MLLWALSSRLSAQRTPQPRAEGREPSLRVYLITIGQGAAYWEKYGHNMLRFVDQSAKLDLAYNWGTFDFTQPGYLRRLLIGDPQYWVDTIPTAVVFQFYRHFDRTITQQQLNLSPAQARAALDRARWNMRPEHRFYRYDYFLDNCSTRVRDLIDLAFGGAIKSASQDTVDQTYRGETLRLLDDMRLTQLGVDIALGRPAGRKLTRWEDMFIPMRMRDALRDMRVRDSTGAMVPVVAHEQVVYESRNHHERTTPPNRWLAYLAIGLLLAVELLIVGFVAERTAKKGPELAFRFEVALWALVTGLLGAVVLGAWLGTQHLFWYRNENLLLANPLSLFLVVLAPLSYWKPRLARAAGIVAGIVALAAAVALVLKGLPSSQRNLELIALLLPPHFAVAFHLWRRATVEAPAPSARP